MKAKQLTREEMAAKMVGQIINIVLTIAGASACIYGIIIWAQRNCNF